MHEALKSIFLIFCTISFLFAQSDPLPLKPTKNISFSTDEGTWMNIDVSPDGKHIVFDLLGDLYLISIRGGKATQITSGMALDTQPRFSPDGSKILFISDRDGAENIWILNLGTTLSSKLFNKDKIIFSAITNGDDASYASPEWSPDGKYVVVSRTPRFTWIDVNHNLWIYHINGGDGTPLFHNDEKIFALGPAFGTDSDHLYFVNRHPENRDPFGHQVEKYNLKTGLLELIATQVGGAIRPAISPDGKWMVYGSRHDGRTGYRLRNLINNTETWLTYPVQQDQQENNWMGTSTDHMPGYSFTPDSKNIITSIDGHIYRVSIPNGVRKKIPFRADVKVKIVPVVHFDKNVPDGPVELTQIRYPELSPNGNELAFTAINKLYVLNLSNGSSKQVVDLDDGQFYPSWSSDGEFIAFVTWNDYTGGHVYKVRPDGTMLKKLTHQSGYYKEPIWSISNKQLFVSMGNWQQFSSQADLRGRGRMNIVSISADSREINHITDFNGSGLHFTNDPTRLYYSDHNDGLASIKLDGTDRKIHLRVYGQRPYLGHGGPVLSNQVYMSPDGSQAIVQADYNIYLVEVPNLGTEVPHIYLDDPTNGFPVKKLNYQDIHFPKWEKSGKKVYWSLGSSLFISDQLSDGYSDINDPEEIKIDLKFSRFKGDGIIAFKGCTILSMDEDLPNQGIIKNGTVIIKNDRIVKIGKESRVKPPPGAKIINGKGMYLLPGFIDLHSHMNLDRDIHRKTLWSFMVNLAYGVTTARDPQSMDINIFTYADRVAIGDMIGPRVFTTGPGIFNNSPVNNLEDAKRIVQKYSDYYRVNTVKQYLSGNRRHRQLLNMAIQDAQLIPTTEGMDMKLMVTQIMDGYSLEHTLPHYPLYKDMIELIVKSGTYYDPTVIVGTGPRAEYYYWTRTDVHGNKKLNHFFPHDILDLQTRRVPWFHESEFSYKEYAKTFKNIVNAGGKIGVGSHGEMQGICYHWELWNIQSGGMSEMDALRCATIIGSEAIGFSNDLGSIEEGKLADLILLTKNPLDDIRNTNSIKYVMKNGILYNADSLDEVWPTIKKLPPQYWHGKTPKHHDKY